MTLFTSPIFGGMRPVDSLWEVASELEKRDDSSSVLVIFDVDDVLVRVADPRFHGANSRLHRDFFESEWALLTLEQKNRALERLFDTKSLELLDPTIPDLISHLHSSGAPVIALTGGLTGSRPSEGTFEHQRLELLSNHRVDFSQICEEKKVIFEQFASSRERFPMYYSGILLTNGFGVGKGDLLKAFFHHINWQPDCIIFIDDSSRHLRSVEKACNDLGIELCALHFTRPSPSPVDAKSFREGWFELIKGL